MMQSTKRRPPLLQTVFLVAAMTVAACTTALYNGPRLPDDKAAVISSGDTRINRVDGKWVSEGSNAKYELLPGPHDIGISLERRRRTVFYERVHYSVTVTLCFEARPGVRYLAVPFIRGDRWMPIIVDRASGKPVSQPCNPTIPDPGE